MQKGCLDDSSYHVNMIINLLMRFPEIFTVTYNLGASSYCLSYMIKGKVVQEDYISLRRRLEENLEAYCYFKKKDNCKIRLGKEHYGCFTRLEVKLAGGNLTGEEISLITRLIHDAFGPNLISELRPDDVDLEDGVSTWEEMMSLISNRDSGSEVNKLFAFREAGKVYVYDDQ